MELHEKSFIYIDCEMRRSIKTGAWPFTNSNIVSSSIRIFTGSRIAILLGFWRGVGYFFSIVTVIGGLAVSFSAVYVTHQIYGFMLLVAGVFSIFLIRIIGSLDSIQYDLRYLASREKKLVELESEKHLDDIDEKDKGEKE